MHHGHRAAAIVELHCGLKGKGGGGGGGGGVGRRRRRREGLLVMWIYYSGADQWTPP